MDLISFIILLVKILIIMFGILVLGAAISVLAERRVSAFIQERLGPNRVGPGGIPQTTTSAFTSGRIFRR